MDDAPVAFTLAASAMSSLLMSRPRHCRCHCRPPHLVRSHLNGYLGHRLQRGPYHGFRQGGSPLDIGRRGAPGTKEGVAKRPPPRLRISTSEVGRVVYYRLPRPPRPPEYPPPSDERRAEKQSEQ